MENNDVLKRLEEKLDMIINLNLKSCNDENLDKVETETETKKLRENLNRKKISKILYSLPELEEYAQLKDLSKLTIILQLLLWEQKTLIVLLNIHFLKMT